MVKALGTQLVGYPEGRFIIPILAGTVVEEVEHVISAKSGHPAIALSPVPLSAEDVVNIIKQRPWPADYLKEVGLWRGLGDMGGHPRAIQLFLDYLETDSESRPTTDFKDAYFSVRRGLKQKLDRQRGAYDDVILCALEGRSVTRSTSLGGITVAQLEDAGVLAFVPEASGEYGQIVLPLVLLVRFVIGFWRFGCGVVLILAPMPGVTGRKQCSSVRKDTASPTFLGLQEDS